MVQNWIEKGIAHCKNTEFEKGVECFDKALSLEHENIQALYNRGRALSRVGNLKASLNDFEKLTQIQPSNPSYIGDYAVALYLNEKNDEALTQFNLALSLEPENPYRYASRAFYYDRIGKFEESIKDYEKTIELDPEDAIAMNNKGLVEEKLGYKDKAKSSFDKSNNLTGYDPDKSPALKDAQATAQQTPPSQNEAQSPDFDNKWDVIKSVFTKEGFKDFLSFSKGIVKKK